MNCHLYVSRTINVLIQLSAAATCQSHLIIRQHLICRALIGSNLKSKRHGMHASRERWCTDARARERNQRGSQRIAQPCMPERDPPCQTPAHHSQTRLPSPLTPPKLPPDHCQALKSRCQAPPFPQHCQGTCKQASSPEIRARQPLSKTNLFARLPRHAMLASRKRRCTDVRARAHGGAARTFCSPASPMPAALRLLGHYQVQATHSSMYLSKRATHVSYMPQLQIVTGACLASWEGRLQRHAHGGAGARLPSPACSMAM